MTTRPLDRHETRPSDLEEQGPSRFAAPSLPDHGVGIGFKTDYADDLLADSGPVSFLEVHAENYMGDGGHPHRILEKMRENFPLSLHGVCMSIGGPEPLDGEHLARFAALVKRYEPALVSEHLAWSTHDDVFLNDLLPLPYTEETLKRVCEHVDEMQEAIGRTILLENPATYVLFKESTIAETDFLREIASRTGCGLLLDVNNVFVSATNHGFSARDYINNFPLNLVGEIHLAGHTHQEDDEGDPLLIDSHNRPVADPVWGLYSIVLQKRGVVPTLVEWDSDLPEWSVLRAEAQSAADIQKKALRLMQPLGHRHAY